MKKAWNGLLRIGLLLFILDNMLFFSEALGDKVDSDISKKEFVSRKKYRVKKSSISLPYGVPLGKYYRIIHPFPNWNLICDVNIKNGTKVCNITQNIIDEKRRIVYSWSLAASETGQPFFIVRLSPSLKVGESVLLDPGDGGLEIVSRILSCDNKYCVAYYPVKNRLKESIIKGSIVSVTYYKGKEKFLFHLPLRGLNEALNAI